MSSWALKEYSSAGIDTPIQFEILLDSINPLMLTVCNSGGPEIGGTDLTPMSHLVRPL